MTSTAVAFGEISMVLYWSKSDGRLLSKHSAKSSPTRLPVPFKHQEIASPAIRLLTLQLGSRYFRLLVRYRKLLIN